VGGVAAMHSSNLFLFVIVLKGGIHLTRAAASKTLFIPANEVVVYAGGIYMKLTPLYSVP
jgi:hypothetical protein